jgi:YVTN family beta-propeller protein
VQDHRADFAPDSARQMRFIGRAKYMKSAIKYGPLHGLMMLALAAPAFAASQQFPTYQVGPQANGTYVMSTGQIVNPAGKVVMLGSPVRAKAVALNPINPNSAAVLVMGAAQAVEVIDPASGAVQQLYSPFGDRTGSFTGISYSPDGTKLLFSQDDSFVAIAKVDPVSGLLSDYEQLRVAPSQAYIKCQGITVGLPSNPINQACGNFYNGNSFTSNPAGIAVSADSKTAYAVLNANNTLQPIDLTIDPPQLKGRQIRVGNAPNSVVVNGTFAYVSNEGGRQARPSDFTNVSNGTPIVASPVSGTAITGTVSVVDLTTNRVTATIHTGLHPTGMTISGGLLFVCNSGSDSISVVDLATNQVMNTINLALPLNDMKSRFGAQPTGIVVVGTVAYVTLYTVNAIAVVDLSGGNANPILGYIPTASTPSTVAFDSTHNQLVVTNDKGLGTWGSIGESHGVHGYNSHQDTAVVNLIPLPTQQQLPALTTQVYQNNHWDLTMNVKSAHGGKSTRPPVAIPAHIGDPSLIKHVFLIVRENRTYDQILGDVPAGNGDPSLAVFGGADTPNLHALVQRFPLLDNYYNPSRQSADGHNWLVQAIAPYMDDIQSPDWIRSYPANGLDALAYQPSGFLWDAAEKMGLPVKIFGEYVEYSAYTKNNDPNNPNPSWSDFYNDAIAYETGQEQQLALFNAVNVISEIPTVQNKLIPNFPPFDLDVPDQFRVDLWQQNFNADVQAGTVPALTTLWIMCDHTGGPPTVNAEQADNDLAVGRIVDAISHSNVWGSSAIFITEDDAQDGVDHVDGHRSPGYVVSPYVVQNQPANHTYFSQVNVARTIEQILGLPPMNQFDLVASPMSNLFTNTPNSAAWTHVPNQIPLDQGVGQTTQNMSPIAKAWAAAKTQIFAGKMNKADSEDPNTVNHWSWYEATGFKRPYPGEKSVRWPSDFTNGIAHPSHDLGD